MESTILQYDRLVLHVPHASTYIPELYQRQVPPVSGSMADITPAILKRSYYLVDYYTDELFVPTEENRQIHSLVFDWNRVLCDVERLPHDPLESINLGIYSCPANGDVYGGRKWYDSMMRYVEHQYELAKLVTSVSFKPGNVYLDVLLIDCHSFSMHPTDLCPLPPEDIDICLGYNEDETRPHDTMIDRIEQYFIEKGYRVGRNKPFSNSKTVPVPVAYHSLMIEVNKSLYMDEDTLEKKPEAFAELHNVLQEMYQLVLR